MALLEQQQQQLIDEFQDRFLDGERFDSIASARRVAAEVLEQPVRPGSALAKETENAVEQSLVRAAKHIIEKGKEEGRLPVETFEQLTDLYDRQPRLGTRSSTSIQMQQYSTPTPLGYLASQLAGIDEATTVYEPTAGHGALLLEANPEKATVNELDDGRVADLRRQGYTVTQRDATDSATAPEAKSQDVVIANPPFSRRRKDGRAEQFKIGSDQTPTQTSQLDQTIAWRSLDAMKDDGRAVLLLAGQKNGSESYRSNQYNTRQNRGFYLNLYRNYRVSDHFTLDGSLYNNQGAGFPVDVITIDGRGGNDRPLPAAAVPRVYSSYDDLQEKFNDRPRPQAPNLSLLRESNGLESAPEGGARENADSPGQFLLGDRAPEPQPDSELRRVPGSAGEPGQLDDPELDGRSTGGDARGASDVESDFERGRTAPVLYPEPGRSDSADLGTGAGGKPMDEQPLDAGDSAGVPDPDGRGLSGEGLDYQRDSGANPRGMDAVVHSNLEQEQNDNGSEKREENENSKTGEGIMVDQQQQLSGQMPYEPRSNGMRLNTLIPRNMGSAVQSALDDLEGRVGDLDRFVSQKLNYSSVEEMQGVLAAEQVDGVALAIDNIEHGTGTLVGDQTGVGKGRQAAALIRYAKESDRTPVFITRDANLYADMIRDLEDIGVSNFEPFITNSQETIPLEDGREIKTTKTAHSAELDRLTQQGGLSPEDGYDGVFTTYSQMQTVKGKETPRREFLNMIAPQSLIIMDEAHMAGGSPQKTDPSARPNRAQFARQLVDKADGIAFSSATAIKRPDVMDLYGRRSGMRDALGSIEKLQQTLEAGGTPLQQVSTNMLGQDGFYTRRERSYEGVEFGIQSVEVDRESTDNLSKIMGSILQFDRAKKSALEDINDDLKKDARKAGEDNAIGSAGASSTNFTSLMHNVMDQSLLARKADQMADEAIDSLERGEKPILAVSNTMGSFIENFADSNDLSPGDEVDADFGDILLRYLYRSRDVLESDYDGTKTRRQLTDDELGPDAVEKFEQAEELIANIDLSFPVSPIDYIKQRVEAAGYEFGEITGRSSRLDYSQEGNPTYERRPGRETSKAAKVETTDSFNSGKTDVLLLNRSGSTGISLHASEKFADQRKRHMIVGQAERNVNDFMQTLGRAHRTGQVVPPKISLMMGDTPDEKRPAALLERKMSSLNANTTADKKSGFDTSEIPDFFNQYGDAVVEQILSEYPEINEKLDHPITVSPDGVSSVEDATEGAIAKVTGRLPLLTVNEQESFYQVLEGEYSSFVDQQKALGNNVLEAEAVDLDARSLAQAEVISRQDGVSSAFGSGVNVEIMDVKAQSYAKTQLEVINEVRENLELDPVDSVEDHDSEFVDQVSQDYSRSLLDKMGKAADRYLEQQVDKARRQTSDPEKQQSLINRDSRRLDTQKQQVSQIGRLRPGQTVRVDPGEGRIFYGAISGIKKRGQSLDDALSADDNKPEAKEGSDSFGSTNPLAPSKWEIQVSLADSAREIPLPLSKVNNGKRMGSVEITPVKKSLMGDDVMPLFDKRQTGQREVRQGFRGNLLRAAEKYGKKGRVINATVSGQGVEPMLLLPAGYDVQKEIANSPVRLPAARNTRQFMEITENRGIVKTGDERITLKAALGAEGEDFVLQTGRKQKDVHSDTDLMASAGGNEFYSISDRMELRFPADRLEEVSHYILEGRRQNLEAVSHLVEARELVGEGIPQFSWSDSVEEVVENAGLPPSVDLSDLDAVRKDLEAALQAEEPSPEPTDPAEPIAEDLVEAPAEDAAEDAMTGPGAAPLETDELIAREEPEEPQIVPEDPNPLADADKELVAQAVDSLKDGAEIPIAAGGGEVLLSSPDDLRIQDGSIQVQVNRSWAEVPSDILSEGLNASQNSAAPSVQQQENEQDESVDMEPDIVPPSDSVESMVEQAQSLADKGYTLFVEVDETLQGENLETNLEPVPGQENRSRFGLLEPTEIRFKDGQVQVEAGVDSSGGTLEPVWVDVPDPERQLNDAIANATPLFEWVKQQDVNDGLEDANPTEEDSTTPTKTGYVLDSEGATTIGEERARLLREPGLNPYDASSVEPANRRAELDEELEGLSDEFGDDALISPTPIESTAEEAPDVMAASEPARVGGWHNQSGRPEKVVGKLLEDAGLSEAVMADSEFYMKVENEPFEPLSIERHSNELYLYHTAQSNGDTFIDGEMTFNLSDDGSLALSGPTLGGVPDRGFASMFARNLREQGFAEAAQAQNQPQAQAEESTEPVEPAQPPEGEAIQGGSPGSPEPQAEEQPESPDAGLDRPLGLERLEEGANFTTEVPGGDTVTMRLSPKTIELYDAAATNAGAIRQQHGAQTANDWLEELMPAIISDSVGGASPEAMETANQIIGGGLQKVFTGEYGDRVAEASPEPQESEPSQGQASQKADALEQQDDLDGPEEFDPWLDRKESPIQVLFEEQPDLFNVVDDSVLDQMNEGPENVFADGEVGYLQMDGQLFSYSTERINEAMDAAGLEETEGVKTSPAPLPSPPAAESGVVEPTVADDDVVPTSDEDAPEPLVPDAEPEPAEAEPEPFDYQQTLDSLRASADRLPQEQQESLLNAIQQAESQLSGETPGSEAELSQAPQDPPVAQKPGSEVVQAAIAQQDPDLGEQMSSGPGTGVPSVEEFRDWYRKASVLGQSEEMLSEIVSVGQQAKSGELVPDGYDASKMQADRQEYDFQSELASDIQTNATRFFDSAQKAGIVLQQPNGGGEVAEGKRYRLIKKDGEMSLQNKESGGELSFKQEGITKLQGLTNQDKESWQRLGSKTPDDLRRTIQPNQSRQPVSASSSRSTPQSRNQPEID